MQTNIAQSVKREIMLGLQKLATLQLENAPAAENLTDTAQVWMEVIGYDKAFGDDAAPRFREAFVQLARMVKRWPSPAHLLEILPPPPPPPALPEPPKRAETPEECAETETFWANINAGLRGAGVNLDALVAGKRMFGKGGEA